MLSNKLITYLQFLDKTKSYFIGEKLFKKLKNNEIKYLFILPDCNEKIKSQLLNILGQAKVIETKLNICPILGYEKLNAFGSSNPICKQIIIKLKEEVEHVEEK